MYADPDLRFGMSESVAPALVFGPVDSPLSLLLETGQVVCASALLHASGVSSALDQASQVAVLYVDPLTVRGMRLQRLAKATVSACASQDLLERHAMPLRSLCSGVAEPSNVRDAVAALLDDVLVQVPASGEVDVRLPGLRAWLHAGDQGRGDPAAVGERLGLSAEHVRKHFRRHVGMTLSRYLAWARLYRVTAAACDAQHVGHAPNATELMLVAGFCDAPHATRTIRRYLDLLPSEMLAPRSFVDCRE
jgi:AraC-like DNA-binding protein